MQILDVSDADLDDLLRLNSAAVPHVNRIDYPQIRWFSVHAAAFLVARIEDRIAGFLIGLRPGLDYRSENYRWFCHRYDDFGYIDRVVVDNAARRLGVASQLYEDFANKLRGKVDRLTCEVNVRPANDGSMRFHARRGFVQVGTQETEGGSKKVALMEMRL